MPQSSRRSWIGVAPTAADGTLSAAVASGATTFTLNNLTTWSTAPATSQYLVIVDGNNTEEVGPVTLTGSVVSGITTVNAHVANCYCYFTAAANSGAAAPAYVPVTKIDAQDNITMLGDKGFRGSMASEYGVQQGLRVGKLSFDGDAFPDTLGYFLASLFGYYKGTAYVSNTSPSSYQFQQANTTPTINPGQPAPILVYVYNPTTSKTRVYARCVVDSFTLKFDPGAMVTYSASLMAYASGNVTNPNTVPPTFTTATPLPSRIAAMTNPSVTLAAASGTTTTITVTSTTGLYAGMNVIVATGTGAFAANTTVLSVTNATSFVVSAAPTTGLSAATITATGSTNTKVLSAEYAWKRDGAAPINTLQGTQDPMQMFVGALDLSIKAKIVPSDDTELNYYLNGVQNGLILTATQGTLAAANGIVIQTSVVNYNDANITRDKAYIELDLDIDALANNTDLATSGTGLSSAKVTLTTGAAGTTTQYGSI